jgi:hypothetical protein
VADEVRGDDAAGAGTAFAAAAAAEALRRDILSLLQHREPIKQIARFAVVGLESDATFTLYTCNMAMSLTGVHLFIEII